MTLFLYLARRFLRAFLIVCGAFAGVLLLIETVEKIRAFGGQNVGLGRTALLALLSAPESLFAILPLIVAMSAMVMFIGMARSSELVVIRAAGRSPVRMLWAPVCVALILGVLAVVVGNPIVTATSKRYDELAGRFSADAATASIGSGGVWMRQGMGDGTEAQAVIRAGRANRDATHLYAASFLIFDPERGPIRRVDAREAVLEPGHWRLTEAKDWPLGSSTNPERDATTESALDLPTDLTVDSIRDSFGAPSSVPIWQLPGFIRSLEEAGFSARRHLVWFQMELALPAVFAAMVLIAAAFTMGHVRFGRTGIMTLIALGAALGAYFLRNIAQVLGENGQIPVTLAAWAPPAIALMFALGFILVREDG